MRDPFQLCQTLLTQVTTRMTAYGSTLPTVQYVAPGQTVAYDGEQVTTNVLRVFAGRPGAEDPVEYSSGFIYMSVEMMVVIVRETPMLEDGVGGAAVIPNPTAIQANAQLMLQDAQNLVQSLIDIVEQKALGNYGMPVTIGPVTTVGPEGGVVAVTGTLTMPLL